MIKKLQVIFLLFVPLLFLIIGLRFDRTQYGTDPESAYLLNGINIGMGRAVGHFDNPGTTVQIYSAVVLRLTHALRNTQEDFQTDVLLHSEYYIEVLRYGLIFINAIMILLLGLVTLSLLGNLWAALVIQLAPFLSVTLMEELFTKVAPEQFLFTAIAFMIILLLKLYKSDDPGKIKYPLAFGLLAGFGLATKMTFLPVLIIPFIVLKGKRNKWIYLISIIPSFVLFTSPAISGYPHMAKWFLNMGTHTGTYGQGNAGIIDPKVYFNSLISIVSNNKELIAGMIIALFALLITLFRRRNRKVIEPNMEFYMLLAVLVAQAGSILLVAKHYHSNHYLFPALSLTGFVFIFIYLLINKHLNENNRKLFRFALPVTIAIIIGFSLLNIPFLTQAYNGYRMSNQSTNETMARLERDYKGFVRVYFYPVSFNEYASLKWGNVYSRQYSTEKLMELFPGGLFYDVRDNIFQFWETTIPPGEFLKKYGGHILMVGGPLNDNDLKLVEAGGLKLKKLFEGRIQVVYEIDTAQSALFQNSIHTGASKKTTSSDFENLSSDGEWVLSNDETRFCKSSALATDKARSGNHSIQLPGMDSYGMEYELGEVNPGDQFEISIWRLNGNKDVFLVASAGTTDPFYLQNSGYVETDSKGWQKVPLDFKIPEDFKGNKLKIYLWNHSNSISWFDDFQLNKY
jgi:hypothetical protein